MSKVAAELLAQYDELCALDERDEAAEARLSATWGQLMSLLDGLDFESARHPTPELLLARNGLICELKKRGATASEMARMLGRHRTWIYRAIKSYPGRKKLQEQHADQ